MRLLLDTHVLIWAPTGDPRLSAAAREAITNPGAELFVSAVTAFELAGLQERGRVAMNEDMEAVAAVLGLSVLDFPGEAWRIAADLPDIHRDPVDRMMIAHAMVGAFTLVSADRNVRRYPVKSLW
ncbi:MAG TPA: type II toxin-antitoxin system VapC family toxin [Allosphingosinicella sp.]|nr:type II toxin-antitoxin system VapC family toxin [Allosphingosinicella sp.]